MRHTTRRTLTAAVVAERYQLEREMARGGMGTVWLARDLKLGRHVAIKVMAQELAQMGEALQRFEREAQALASLRSMHVVQVFDYGIQEGLPFIVMELLEGENLTQRLRRVGRLGIQEATTLFQQVCKGLKAAHNANLIHRDLKPSNIFIARRDDTEVVKLLDFGVVKAIDAIGSSDATASGMLLGTPQYMSPEQARATRNIDHRSDLWSAAVIAFRMLTGQNPFKGESVGDVVLKICSDALPKITDYRHDLPPVLDTFFAKAFERDPTGRYQSATEMADALTRMFVAAGLAAAPPPTMSQSGYEPPRAMLASSPEMAGLQPSGPPSLPPVVGDRGSSAQGAVFTSAPPTPISNMIVGDATPISTTVGGTQLSPLDRPLLRPLSAQPLALVVGGAASLITLALVVAIWLGSSEPQDPVGQSPAARGDVDLTSEDDDGTPTAEESAAEETTTSPVEDEPEPEPEPSAEALDLDEDEPGSENRGKGKGDGMSTSGGVPTSTATTGTSTTTKQKPSEKGDKGKPDWGLGGK